VFVKRVEVSTFSRYELFVYKRTLEAINERKLSNAKSIAQHFTTVTLNMANNFFYVHDFVLLCSSTTGTRTTLMTVTYENYEKYIKKKVSVLKSNNELHDRVHL